MREKPKRKKLSARKLAKAYADRWCREYAHKRYPACVTCGAGKEKVLQWAHLFTARNESTRWDIYNFAVQCSGCNLRHEHDPGAFTVWFLLHYGRDAYEALWQRHHSLVKLTTDDIREIGDHYRDLIQRSKT